MGYASAAAQARAANERRYKEGMGILDQIIARYEPGGSFGKGAESVYQRGKTQAVSASQQSLVSAGLANTTIAATIDKKYEEEVGNPFRLQLEDMRMDRLSEAQMSKVGFIERREDAYPDAGLMAQYAQGAGYGQGLSSVEPQSYGWGGGSSGKTSSRTPRSSSSGTGSRSTGAYTAPTFATYGTSAYGAASSFKQTQADIKRQQSSQNKKKQKAKKAGTTYQPFNWAPSVQSGYVKPPSSGYSQSSYKAGTVFMNDLYG